MNRTGPRRLHLLLAYLASLPRTGIFLAALVVVVAGLFLPGLAGAVLLLAIVAGMAALLTLTWAGLPPQRRVLQILALALLLVVAAYKLA